MAKVYKAGDRISVDEINEALAKAEKYDALIAAERKKVIRDPEPKEKKE